MADSRLLVTNLATTATWSQTTGATATGYPLTNLNNTKRGLVWRSTQTTADKVIVATYAAQTIKAILLINYLNHSGGTIKAESKNGGGGYSNFGGGTGLFTIPSSNRTRLIALYDTTGVTSTDTRISFLNGGAVNAYVELGCAFIGTYSQPTRSLAPGFDIPPVDPSLERYAEGGQKYTWGRQKFLKFGATYRVNDTDKDTIQQAYDTLGRGTPFVFAIDPTDLDLTAYGYLQNLSVGHLAETPATRPYYNLSLAFEEAR